jgi:GDP-L-fucose synthase
VTIWRTGSALREFLYTDDLVDACIYLMSNYDDCEIVNIGSGEEVSIKHLALTVKNNFI